MSYSRFSDIRGLNNEEAQVLQHDYRPDFMYSNAFPTTLQSPYISQKGCDLASDILNGSNNHLAFTTNNSEQFLSEAYELAYQQQPDAFAKGSQNFNQPSQVQ